MNSEELGFEESDLAEYVVYDPIVVERVDLFLQGCRGLATADPAKQRELAETLCELSRDIRFHLGPPTEAPEFLVRRIINLFRRAVELIQPTPGDMMFAKYREHLERRAKILESAFSSVMAHAV